jgi:hypothetical protein
MFGSSQSARLQSFGACVTARACDGDHISADEVLPVLAARLHVFGKPELQLRLRETGENSRSQTGKRSSSHK